MIQGHDVKVTVFGICASVCVVAGLWGVLFAVTSRHDRDAIVALGLMGVSIVAGVLAKIFQPK